LSSESKYDANIFSLLKFFLLNHILSLLKLSLEEVYVQLVNGPVSKITAKLRKLRTLKLQTRKLRTCKLRTRNLLIRKLRTRNLLTRKLRTRNLLTRSLQTLLDFY
jgi:hypothetical protein